MGWTSRIAIAVVVLLVLGAIGLTIYGGMLSPPHKTYQQAVTLPAG